MSDPIPRLLEAIEAREQKARRASAGVIKWDATPEMAEVIRDHLPDDVLRRCEAEKKLIAAYQGVDEAIEAADEHNKENPVAIGLHAGLNAGVLAIAASYGITEEET